MTLRPYEDLLVYGPAPQGVRWVLERLGARTWSAVLQDEAGGTGRPRRHLLVVVPARRLHHRPPPRYARHHRAVRSAEAAMAAWRLFDAHLMAGREMRRVLVPGGRVALGVLRPRGHNRAYGRFADALDHHVGSDAGAVMRAPFPELAADDLRALLRGAGFDRVVVRIAVTSVRYPSVAEMVRQETVSSPLAAHLAEVDDASRAALVEETGRLLADHLDDEGVVLPVETNLATGERPALD